MRWSTGVTTSKWSSISRFRFKARAKPRDQAEGSSRGIKPRKSGRLVRHVARPQQGIHETLVPILDVVFRQDPEQFAVASPALVERHRQGLRDRVADRLRVIRVDQKRRRAFAGRAGKP